MRQTKNTALVGVRSKPRLDDALIEAFGLQCIGDVPEAHVFHWSTKECPCVADLNLADIGDIASQSGLKRGLQALWKPRSADKLNIDNFVRMRFLKLGECFEVRIVVRRRKRPKDKIGLLDGAILRS